MWGKTDSTTVCLFWLLTVIIGFFLVYLLTITESLDKLKRIKKKLKMKIIVSNNSHKRMHANYAKYWEFFGEIDICLGMRNFIWDDCYRSK